MPNEQIVTYIRDRVGQGIQHSEIRNSLVAVGWPVADISASFASLGIRSEVGPMPPVAVPPPPQPTPSAPVAVKYAGFWVRAAALMVDGIILGIAQTILMIVLGKSILTTLVVYLLGWVYAVFMITEYRATLGKMAVGLHVERVSGEKIDFWRACLREVVGKMLSGIILGIGFLMIAWTGKKQGLHDKIADTVVVENDPSKSKTLWVVLAAIFAGLLPLIIVGILSSVILASLSVAQTKGKDAAVSSYLSQLRVQGELYYSTQNNSYSGYCQSPTARTLLEKASVAGSATSNTNAYVCNDSATAWAVSVPLRSTGYGCIGSSDDSTAISTSLVNGQTSCK